MKIFKIRNKATGLWSTGGSSPRWTKKGKIWSTYAHVKSHLRGVAGTRYATVMNGIADWEIVELEVIENSVSSALDIVNAFEAERKEKERLYQERQNSVEALRKRALGKLTTAEKMAIGVDD